MAWRSPELEAVLGGPLEPATQTEEALRSLVEGAVTESEQLEFKNERYRAATGKSKDEQKYEAAKDIAALANQRGGLLLIGVAETEGAARRLQPVTGETAEHEEQWLRLVAATTVQPACSIDVITVQAAAGDFYLAVIVPPSPLAPHAVVKDPGDATRPLRFPQRSGRDTRWLSESDVARA